MAKNVKKLSQEQIDFVIAKRNLKLLADQIKTARLAAKQEREGLKAAKAFVREQKQMEKRLNAKLRADKKLARDNGKVAREAAKAAKLVAREQKQAEKTVKLATRIAKAQARLDALVAKQFAPKSIKRKNRKAGKVVNVTEQYRQAQAA